MFGQVNSYQEMFAVVKAIATYCSLLCVQANFYQLMIVVCDQGNNFSVMLFVIKAISIN